MRLRSSGPVLLDAIGNPLRRLSRTVLTGVGTLLGVAAFVATVGLVATAGHQVSSTFDALRATQVSFTGNDLVSNSDSVVKEVAGAVSGGSLGQLFAGAEVPVARLPATGGGATYNVDLAVNEASPGALQAMNLTLQAGRSLTTSDVDLHLPVALLGASAASKLQIGPLAAEPVIFIGATPVTVVGVISNATRDQDLLAGVIVTFPLATRLEGVSVPTQQIIVDTRPGAAQQVGRQEPLVLSPDPATVQANVPPDPNTLRRSVVGPVRILATLLAGVTIIIGVLSIGNVASLSVIQRTQELGLRRAVGASRTDIFVMILTESLFVGGLSGVLGSSVGVLTVGVVSAAEHWEAVLNPTAPLLAPVLGAATGLLAGLIPAYRATRIPPAEALRSA